MTNVKLNKSNEYGNGRLRALKEMKEWHQNQIDNQRPANSKIAELLQQGEVRAHKKAIQKIVDKESKSLIKSIENKTV